jgi:thiamine transport system permease protein
MVEGMGRALRAIAWVGPIAFMGLFFYFPLSRILTRAVSANSLTAIFRPEVGAVVWFTLWQALASIVICLAIGLPMAFLLYRRSFFGSKLIRSLLAVPFVLPTIVVAIALAPMRGLPGWLAILVANAFLNISVIVRMVGSVWGSIDSNLDSSAQMDGATTFATILRVHLPILRAAIFNASVLVFLYCVTSFGIVLVFGGSHYQSIETMIYFALNNRLNLNLVGGLAVIQTVITVVAFALAKPTRIENSSAEMYSPVKRASRPAVFAFFAFVAAFFAFPIFTILVNGLTVTNLTNLSSLGSRELLDIPVWQAIANSVRNAFVATVLAVTVGTLVARLSHRHRWTHFWFILPLGISSVLLGFGFLVSFGAGLFPYEYSWLVVPIVQAVLAIPLVVQQMIGAQNLVPLEIIEAASNAGANRWQSWWQIELPVIIGPLRNSIAFAFLVSIGEFGAASLLSYGNQATLPVVLYRLISRPGGENYGMAMAAASLIILLAFAVVTVTSLDRKQRRLYSTAM